MLQKELTLEKWVKGAIKATEASNLQGIVPLHQISEEKRTLVLFVMGTMAYVKAKLRELLSKHSDIEHAITFVETEGQDLSEAQKPAGVEQTADWLEKAGASPNDSAGSMILGLIFTERYRALQIAKELELLSADEHYKEELAKLHPVQEILAYIDNLQKNSLIIQFMLPR